MTIPKRKLKNWLLARTKDPVNKKTLETEFKEFTHSDLGLDGRSTPKLFRDLIDELTEADELVSVQGGPGGAYQRTSHAQNPRGKAPSKRTSNGFIKLLPKDGTYKTNAELRKALGVTKKQYLEIRKEFLERNEIELVRTRGGGVRLSERAASKEPIKKQKLSEQELYEPFTAWLRESFTEDEGISAGEFVIDATANQGSKDTGGKWTRPDRTIVVVRSYEFFPGRTLEVISFEIKPLKAIPNIAWVFETAAQSIFANRSFLALHVADNTDLEIIRTHCERFGIGLITFLDPEDHDSYELVLEAEHKTPGPAEINDFIKKQLSKESQKQIKGLIEIRLKGQ